MIVAANMFPAHRLAKSSNSDVAWELKSRVRANPRGRRAHTAMAAFVAALACPRRTGC